MRYATIRGCARCTLAMLEIDHLSGGYGRAQVLFDVRLEVAAGEVVGLLGRNGAGKSTTLKTIMGLLPPFGGEVRLDGKRIDRLQPHDVSRAGLGYVPEDRRIFTDLTVQENLEVGRQEPRPGMPAWTQERLMALFPALASMLERRAGQMSGGEQQMLCIARTLAGNPRAILLDEPSEGLAPLVVAQIARAIGELKHAGVTVLLAEQGSQLARRLVDRSYTLERGRITHGQ
jgi:branched-chain amino acid transport system ATP-binding protein